MGLSNAQAEQIVDIILGILADWSRTPEAHRETVRKERQQQIATLIEIHGSPVGLFLAIHQPVPNESGKQWVLPVLARIHSSELTSLLGDLPISALYNPLQDIELETNDSPKRRGRMQVFGVADFAGYVLRVCSSASAARSFLGQLELKEREEQQRAERAAESRERLWRRNPYQD